ncbi:hypothetical protein PNOK_0375700 [Pyrrhoderma noxium]|uniref:Uncharacterized protein n=1 Tax=Pyrrhoderma noxium TaxID=2282107 RepID=A0A286UNI6_9AGAM|nr:hypothetical protein PNOK_0375700 [Pyrrhoderma noxium]
MAFEAYSFQSSLHLLWVFSPLSSTKAYPFRATSTFIVTVDIGFAYSCTVTLPDRSYEHYVSKKASIYCWVNTSSYNYHKKSRSHFCNLAPFGKDIKVRRTAATAFLHLINKMGNCFTIPLYQLISGHIDESSGGYRTSQRQKQRMRCLASDLHSPVA